MDQERTPATATGADDARGGAPPVTAATARRVLGQGADRLGGARAEQRPVVVKRRGLAALLALGVLLGAAGPAEAAGSVGSSSAGNDYGRPRASAGER